MAGIPKDPYAGITGFMLGPSMASGKRDMKTSLPGDPFLLAHGYAKSSGLPVCLGPCSSFLPAS